MLCAPSTTSLLVTQKPGAIKSTFSYGAPYVFAQSGLYENSKWDNGDNTMQCTRRPDILKFWLMWKGKVSGAPAPKPSKYS